jgi:hypothetical protein
MSLRRSRAPHFRQVRVVGLELFIGRDLDNCHQLLERWRSTW